MSNIVSLESKKKKVRDNLFMFLFMVGIITSIAPYYFWNYNIAYLQLLAFLCYGLWDITLIKKRAAIFLLLFMFYLYSAINQMEGAVFFKYVYTFLPFNLYLISGANWEKIYRYFNNIYSITLIPSIVLFVLVVFLGMDFPSKTIPPVNVEKSYDYQAYWCLLVSNDLQPFRFRGYYDEAGVVGTISGLLLVINRCNLKEWKNWPLLISGLFSFSLFFYILLSLYLVLFARTKIKITALLIAVIAFSYISFEDTYFSNLILSRLESGDDGWVGDNRTTGGFADFYQKFLHSDKLWAGYGTKYCETHADVGGCSYKHILVNQGLIMTLIYVVGIELYYIWQCGLSKNTFLLSMAFLSLMYQRPYLYSAGYLLFIIAPIYILKNGSANTNEVGKRIASKQSS